MTDQTSTDSLIGSNVARLKDSGEGAFNKLSEQLLENPLFLDAMRRTLAAKGQVDRTISGTMDLVNLPSKNDVTRIVEELESMSAHADSGELMRWLGGFTRPPSLTCLVHGEPDSMDAFRQLIEARLGWPVRTPDYLDTIAL